MEISNKELASFIVTNVNELKEQVKKIEVLIDKLTETYGFKEVVKEEKIEKEENKKNAVKNSNKNGTAV